MLKSFRAFTVILAATLSAPVFANVRAAEQPELRIALQDSVPVAADPVVTGSLVAVEAEDSESSAYGGVGLLGAALLGLGFLARSRKAAA
jgi:hypothetical protein